MKGLLVLLLICVLLVLTNPSVMDHKQAVFEVLRTEVTQSGGLAGFLGNIGVNLAESWDILPFTYQNYYLFSTLSLEGEIISFGVLGSVFLIPQR